MIEDEIKKYVMERDVALTNEDLDWLRKHMPPETSDLVVEITLHKSRYEAVNIDPKLRHDSRKWLESRGYERMCGPFPPIGHLPT